MLILYKNARNVRFVLFTKTSIVSFIEFVEMVCVMLLGAIKTCIHFEKSPRSLIAVRVIIGYRDIH